MSGENYDFLLTPRCYSTDFNPFLFQLFTFPTIVSFDKLVTLIISAFEYPQYLIVIAVNASLLYYDSVVFLIN